MRSAEAQHAVGRGTVPPMDVEVTHEGAIATLWLNRPDKRNAVTIDMWRAMTEHCAALAEDPAVRVLVVRGTGEHFCAGADIGALGTVDNDALLVANHAADDALTTFPKPTIAFITGSCVGGGAEIAIACDLRIADTTSRFGITPARLGLLYPTFALERAVRLLGASAAKHLLYSAELIDADAGTPHRARRRGPRAGGRDRASRRAHRAPRRAVAAHAVREQGDGRFDRRARTRHRRRRPSLARRDER